MKRRSFLFVAPFCLLGVPAAALETPAQFALDVSDRLAAIVADTNITAPERQVRLRQLLREAVDREGISRFVLGRYWRDASEQQRRDFVAVFDDYVVQIYAMRIHNFSSTRSKAAAGAAAVRLTVLSSRAEAENMTVVASQVVPSDGGPPVRIDWRIAGTPTGFKVDDLIVEGISMKLTQRQEFTAVMQNVGGVDGLIRMLRERIEAQR